ncbi:MAG: GatB/YqeY domain-containing protein [Gemmataceae bacterium]
MSLKESVRQKFEQARRAGNREEKDLLSVILGDIATAEARSGKELPDPDVEKVLRKMVESNTETLSQLRSHNRGDAPQVAVLEREIAVLKSLLPATLDAQAIVQALLPIKDDIVSAKSDGQATGLAMKHLKGLSLSVQGQDVSAAVKEIRMNK